jgi:rare lipoprotein A
MNVLLPGIVPTAIARMASEIVYRPCHVVHLPDPCGSPEMLTRRPDALASIVPLWVLLAVMSLLGACASGPHIADSEGKRTDIQVAAQPKPATAPLADGPPERPPADLLAVPDAQPLVEPILPSGPNKPYEVLGQAYAPLASDVPFTQRGQASWYGNKFHGRRTASGEVYSMYGMTAAHRTLPIPSYARVRNLANGKEVIVRINDRGPFHGGRVLDLSYTAAAKLDVLSHGVAEVQIERLTFEQIRSGQWHSALPALAQADDAPAARAVGSEQVSARKLAPADAASDPIYALAAQLDEARPAPRAVPGSKPERAVKTAGAASAASLASSPTASATALPGPSAALLSVAPPAPEPSAPPDKVTQVRAYTPTAKGFWVQLAAFKQRQGVDAFQQRVAKELHHLAPLLAVFDDGALLRLQVGPYRQRDDAQSVAQRVREALHLTPMVVERR